LERWRAVSRSDSHSISTASFVIIIFVGCTDTDFA
jgi:hypothetical protein